MENKNQGHRERLRDRYIHEGAGSFEDHEVLELLLFQYLPYSDTNKLAHTLIDTFGSFANVLDAKPDELMTVDGVSKATACNIALLKDVFFRYKQSYAKSKSIKGLSSIIKYAQDYVADCKTEKFLVIYVDNATRFLAMQEFNSLSVLSVNVDIKKIISKGMGVSAGGMLLFHCHVKGSVEPSVNDEILTEQIYLACASMNMILLDHIIFNTDTEYYSFYEHGFIEAWDKKYHIFKEK